MRVAIVQEHVDLTRGGAETSTLEMARHLARCGVEVTILCRGPLSGPPVAPDVAVRPLPAPGPTRAVRTYRYVQAVHRLCRLEPFDIVHAVTPCLAADVYQPRGGTYTETMARSLAPVASPVMRWLRAFGRRFTIRQRFLMRLERKLLARRPARVVVAAVSEYVRRQVEAQLTGPSRSRSGGHGSPPAVRVVFNGVDMAPWASGERARRRAERRAGLGLDDATPLVLFAAHNFKLKGLAELIRAAACPGDGRAWLAVIAGRDNPQWYRRLAQRLGVADRARFVGNEASLRDWYAAADVLAHPTWYDPCSRVVLEALSLGLPVVTTRYNGAAEVMVPGRHGEILDEAGDVKGLAAALERALRPEVRAACESDAPRLAEQLSMARHARELKALYEERLAAR